MILSVSNVWLLGVIGKFQESAQTANNTNVHLIKPIVTTARSKGQCLELVHLTDTGALIVNNRLYRLQVMFV